MFCQARNTPFPWFRWLPFDPKPLPTHLLTYLAPPYLPHLITCSAGPPHMRRCRRPTPTRCSSLGQLLPQLRPRRPGSGWVVRRIRRACQPYPLDVGCDVGVDSWSRVVYPAAVGLPKGYNTNEEPEKEGHRRVDSESGKHTFFQNWKR